MLNNCIRTCGKLKQTVKPTFPFNKYVSVRVIAYRAHTHQHHIKNVQSPHKSFDAILSWMAWHTHTHTSNEPFQKRMTVYLKRCHTKRYQLLCVRVHKHTYMAFEMFKDVVLALKRNIMNERTIENGKIQANTNKEADTKREIQKHFHCLCVELSW